MQRRLSLMTILSVTLALIGAACGRQPASTESATNVGAQTVTNASATNTVVVPPNTVNTPPQPTNIDYPSGYSY